MFGLCFIYRLDQIFKFAEDIEIDVPRLWKFLGELMGPTAFDGSINLDDFFKCALKYVSRDKAAKLFAHMQQAAINDTVSCIPGGLKVFFLIFFLRFLMF